MKDLVITDVNEVRDVWYIDFYFKANGVNYFLHVLEDLFNENVFSIGEIHHDENECTCCGDVVIDSICENLRMNKRELFNELIKHSKNRLRWVTKNVTN